MSECNIRIQGTIEKYKKSPTGLVNDYRVSSSAVRLYLVMLDFEYKKAFVSVELLAKKMLNKKAFYHGLRIIFDTYWQNHPTISP